jgi:hypothetical protein
VNVGRIRASLSLLSLLAVGAWIGSSVAHGASTEQAPLPGVSVPSVTATVPLVGTVATPTVSVAVPSVTASIPAVTATVPAVTATVPAVTVTAPVVGVAITTPTATVATPTATVATPSVGVTTPEIATTTPLASVVGAVTTASGEVTKSVTAVVTTATKATSATATTATGTSTTPGATTTSARTGSTAAATRAARARRLRHARHRRHVRARRTIQPSTETTPATSTTPVASTPSLTFTLTPPDLATQTIPGPGDGALLVLTTPMTSSAFPFDLPFLPIITAANAGPNRLLSSGPGASSYRLDAVPFTAPLLTGGFNGESRFVASLLPQLSLASVVKPAAAAPSLSSGAEGGRSPVAPAGGGRGIGVELPIIGRIAITGNGYELGRWRYPLASVGGIATTALLSLAALAAISALFAGVSAGAAILRRRRAEACATPVAEPISEPGIDEGWDL